MLTNKLVFEEIMNSFKGGESLELLADSLKSYNNKTYKDIILSLTDTAFFGLLEMNFVWALDEVFDTADNPTELFVKMLNIMLAVSTGVLEFKEVCKLKEK